MSGRVELHLAPTTTYRTMSGRAELHPPIIVAL